MKSIIINYIKHIVSIDFYDIYLDCFDVCAFLVGLECGFDAGIRRGADFGFYPWLTHSVRVMIILITVLFSGLLVFSLFKFLFHLFKLLHLRKAKNE